MKYKLEKQYHLPNYDYTAPGWFFITICSSEFKCHLGRILNEKVYLSNVGEIIKNNLHRIPKHFKTIVLDEYIVMPNHLHCIIVITRRNLINQIPTGNAIEFESTFAQNFSKPTKRIWRSGIVNNPMEMKNISLGKIIRWFKAKCCREIRKINRTFKWQPRYHERIIRDYDELERTREYIKNNPLQWRFDRNNLNTNKKKF
ncbi:transposase [Patescibacteria group bacterium]